MTCPTCHYPLIPGITSCVQCGATADDYDGPLDFTTFCAVEGIEASGVAEEDIAKWQAEHRRMRAYVRATTEARCLEAAGDTAGATAIYEELLRLTVPWGMPYQRLAILYRKAKRAADHERVVRLALAHVGGGAQGWFVLRLAKMLGARR
ncbi:MAG: hypothetical protein C0499_02665 [Zymomonas sp.]|nr:hypothetical protein [Zymomonas sp.]